MPDRDAPTSGSSDSSPGSEQLDYQEGRLYRIWIRGSSEPISVVVPIHEDYYEESHVAIMFARERAEPWLRGRILEKTERGPLVSIAKGAEGGMTREPLPDRSDIEPVIRVTDALGHDLLATTENYARQMLTWLDLEAVAGEMTPGLAELRDRLRAQLEEC